MGLRPRVRASDGRRAERDIKNLEECRDQWRLWSLLHRAERTSPRAGIRMSSDCRWDYLRCRRTKRQDQLLAIIRGMLLWSPHYTGWGVGVVETICRKGRLCELCTLFNELHISLAGLSSIKKDLYKIKLGDEEWTKGRDMPMGKIRHTCSPISTPSSGTKIVAVGGTEGRWAIYIFNQLFCLNKSTWALSCRNSEQYVDSVYIYTIRDDTWETGNFQAKKFHRCNPTNLQEIQSIKHCLQLNLLSPSLWRSEAMPGLASGTHSWLLVGVEAFRVMASVTLTQYTGVYARVSPAGIIIDPTNLQVQAYRWYLGEVEHKTKKYQEFTIHLDGWKLVWINKL